MVLATAGEERMLSSRPKPLHLLGGRPMVQYVVDALAAVDADRVVIVVGDGGDLVAKKLSETAADPRMVFAEQRGVGTAAENALLGLEVFADDFREEDMIVLPGNAPLLRPELIAELFEHHRRARAAITVLGVETDATTIAPRIVEGDEAGRARGIDLDSADDRLADGGVYCVRRTLLAPALRRLAAETSADAPLCGVVNVLTAAGHQASVFDAGICVDAQAVDDRIQLASAEAVLRQRTNLMWMESGVTMIDPARTYIDTTVRLSPDVTLFPGTMLQGTTVVGPSAEIGPDTRLADCAVGSRARVEKTMGREAEVGEASHVGPFAVLQPGSQIPAAAVTGPFYHAVAPD